MREEWWPGRAFIRSPYPERQARLAGETSYTMKTLMSLAVCGIFSFSTVPLRVATWVGLTASGLSLAGIVYALVVRLFTVAVPCTPQKAWLPWYGCALATTGLWERCGPAVALAGALSGQASPLCCFAVCGFLG